MRRNQDLLRTAVDYNNMSIICSTCDISRSARVRVRLFRMAKLGAQMQPRTEVISSSLHANARDETGLTHPL